MDHDERPLFDPVLLGRRETEAWAAYYRHEWPRALRAFVGMVAEGFRLGPARTLVGAWHVLAANRAWAPFPDNDPAAARAAMRRFYTLVRARGLLHPDPEQAARLEVRWWALHRDRQRADGASRADLEQALVDLYAHVYAITDPGVLRPAARARVEAMDLSDRWVAAGRHRADPLLAAERRALVASYSALLDALARERR